MAQDADHNPVDLPIDEIPTCPSIQKAVVVSIASILLGLLGFGFWSYGLPAYETLLESNVEADIYLEDTDVGSLLPRIFELFLIVGIACGVAGVLSLLRVVATYQLLRTALFLVYPAVLGYAVLVWLAVFGLIGEGVAFDGGPKDRGLGVLYWWGLAWPALAVGVYAFWLHMMLWSRSVHAAFTKREGSAMRGDKLLEDWRTHGKDPRARRSFYTSFATHVMVLVIIPFLLQQRGCVEPYKMPKGEGDPVAAVVQVTTPKPVKKKKLTLRPDSEIMTDLVELPDETEVDKEMEEKSTLTFEARVKSQGGKTGAGKGKKGGWPNGTEDYRIQFIRLKHGGKGWDDGMKDDTQADARFLRAFAKATGFTNHDPDGKAIAISSLAQYPDDGFPPFVYITGNADIRNVSDRDKRILREYLYKGGMLFADAGSKQFHDSFMRLMKSTLGKEPADLADDEMILREPYTFPDGAPPLAAHGGNRAKGIKHKGRWIVFYHPGDMNDYWKSEQYTDYDQELRDASYLLGVNVIYYAFTQCSEIIGNQR